MVFLEEGGELIVRKRVFKGIKDGSILLSMFERKLEVCVWLVDLIKGGLEGFFR